MNNDDNDLIQFLECVASVANGNHEAIHAGANDAVGELELNALAAAANAFACYQLARALRREYDARQAAAALPVIEAPVVEGLN